jgi:cobalt-zinc-cadmium efflux system outer membrane protein
VLARQWALADGGLFSHGELGVGAERDLDGSTMVGPNVGLELPIFDQGDAEAEVAMARWLMGRKQFESRAVVVRSQARIAREQVIRARHRVEYHRDTVLPLRRSVVEAAQKEYNFMLLGVYHLLRLKQEEYDAQREHIEALADYWKARAMLDLAVGGRVVPSPDAMPTKPAHSTPGATN